MGAAPSVIIQIIYVAMQLLNSIWTSPVGEEFRQWYKRKFSNTSPIDTECPAPSSITLT